jgi:phosphinothricin acetyltransferase
VIEDGGGEVIAFASTSEYRSRECYAGIGEFSVYVTGSARSRGVGLLAMQELIKEARDAGFWNSSRASGKGNARRARCSVSLREVGIYKRHAQMPRIWRDVVIVEGLLTEP